MNKKHKGNKPFDEMHIRRGKSLYKKLIKKYNIKGKTFSHQMFALGEYLLSKNGVEKPEIVNEPSLDGDHRFECNKLCKNFKGCTSPAMFDLGEIKARNCYVPNYPQYCNFLLWEGSPYGDPEKPYPKCLDPKPPVAIPRDRIITDPQICWRCMKIKKRKKEQDREKALARRTFREPKVYWGNSEGGSVSDYR